MTNQDRISRLRQVTRDIVETYGTVGGINRIGEKNLPSQQAIVEAILEKHHAATAGQKFNAILATASINHAIEYHRLFKEIQVGRKDTGYVHGLKAVVFCLSPDLNFLEQTMILNSMVD